MSLMTETWDENYAPPTGWYVRWLLLRLRFETWKMNFFRLWKPPIDNGAK